MLKLDAVQLHLHILFYVTVRYVYLQLHRQFAELFHVTHGAAVHKEGGEVRGQPSVLLHRAIRQSHAGLSSASATYT